MKVFSSKEDPYMPNNYMKNAQSLTIRKSDIKNII